MKLKKLTAVLLAAVITTSGVSAVNGAATGESNVLPYQNESLSFEERAADLVSRMTLEEKVSQLGYNAPAISRLGVSKYNYWREALHGVARNGKATSFPSALSMSNTWDIDLYAQEGDVIGTEARAKAVEKGIKDLSYWTPTINMARDPRWGRNDESFGEDPYLTTEYGSEMVSGMQGDDETYLKVIATLKHYVANNCEGERQTGSSVMDEQTLRDYYGRAFEDIIENASPASVMSSCNATTITRQGTQLFDYIPSSSNPYLLTELLRRKWGFVGYVVADCGSVNNNYSRLQYKSILFPDAEDLSEITQAQTFAPTIKAGNDLDCGSVSQSVAYEAVENGYLTEEEVDLAVYRMFLQRFRTGEFDSTNPYAGISTSELEAADHVELAERAAEESVVMLKNDGILPIDASASPNIAIVGDMAGTTYLGDYSGEPTDTTSPYEGLCEVFGSDNVHYLGNVEDDTVLFNIKSLNFVKTDGTKVAVDLSKATSASGLTVSGSSLINITNGASAVIEGVSFADVASVEAEISTGYDSPGGTITIGYGDATLTVSTLTAEITDSLDTYATVTADYTGSDGGYNGTANLVISAAAVSEFSVEDYKTQLDAADIIIAYGATTTSDASESKDRSSIAMPSHQAHVAEIAAAYPDKTVVVLQTVGQMDVSSFEDNAKAILWSCYNGQKQGLALAKIISGEVNPSGRLSTTWYAPADLLKMPIGTTTKTTENGISYSRNENYKIRQESNYPGRTYQYYNGTPVYSFGYGLSYTDFTYSGLSVSSHTVDANGQVTVSVNVKNTGDVDGTDVVQLYVKSPNGDGVNLPLKQLKGFERVTLAAGETKTVTMTLDIADLHFYDESTQLQYVPTGTYTLMVGKNANDADMLSQTLSVTGTLASELDVVCAVPDGIKTVGAVNDDGTLNVSLTSVNANLSAYMSDEAEVALDSSNTAYTSSDESVATVDENGVISAGYEEGTALITAEVTVNGVTKSTVIPVANYTKAAVTEEMIAEYLAKLLSAYESYDKSLYSDENVSLFKTTYDEAKASIEVEIDSDLLVETYDDAVALFASIRTKPAAGTSIYEITSINDTVYGTEEMEITYNGDSMNPSAVLITAVYSSEGELEKILTNDIADTGSYVVEGSFANGTKLEHYIWDSVDNMEPLSDKLEREFTIAADANVVVYNLTESTYDDFGALTEGDVKGPINGLYATGGVTSKSKNVSYTFNGETYKFTRAMQTGSGSTSKANFFFTPDVSGYTKCTITVIFDGNGSAGRTQYISQNGKDLASAESAASGLTEVTATTTDLKNPVYTYGGGANKNIYAIIAAYE